ncbi:PI31 proteasome regulator N-terminal-domain-containing protein [Dichomitus squalens]|uniref:PI31 proteasome regulator N-terminal-domain-containing protein n=1 Tax=Dichomitus squalens TaxID=114155 RepID=A0A4Q9MZH9_9APHY|nr:PI31 proteasome regulator N-terminal-domain-containing protein [Dichomitus squalens]
MTTNVLDASALLQTLPTILPPGKKKLESQQDAIAALVHTVLTVLGFRLTGVDESAPTRTFENNVFPEEWNQHGPGHYTLKYRHEQSSLDFLVKVTKLGSRTLVNSIAVETDKVASLDIPTNDFTSPSFFPHELSESSSPFVHGFISSNRVDDLISQLRLTTVQKLIPGLRKEGYTETVTETETRAGPSQPRAPQPDAPPARPRPDEPPLPPGRSPAGFPYPRNPLEIGRRDLDPFPSNPFAPPPLFGSNGGGGMFVGPDHPIFGAGIRDPGPGGMGPWGGDGYLPPLGAPPGARFDPIGPAFGPGVPFPGRMPPGGRGGPFGGQDPDNDELPPPGSRDMFM